MNVTDSNRQAEIETAPNQDLSNNKDSYTSYWPLIDDASAEEAAPSGWIQYHPDIIHYGELAEGCDFIRITPGPGFAGSKDCIFSPFIRPFGSHNPAGRPARRLLRYLYETVYGQLPVHVLVKRPKCQTILRRRGRRNEFLQCFNPEHASIVEIGTRQLPQGWHANQGGDYEIDRQSGCWIWKGNIKEATYGAVSIHGINWQAHHAVYESIKGKIEPGLILRHAHGCPKLCVNPDHLTPGTYQENALDTAWDGPPPMWLRLAIWYHIRRQIPSPQIEWTELKRIRQEVCALYAEYGPPSDIGAPSYNLLKHYRPVKQQ